MPFMLLILAPIRFRGVMILAIGLEFRESSPDKTQLKLCPDKIPEINRVVVPLFPTFKVSLGALRPLKPFPRTRIRLSFFSISMPIFRKQSIVERQSAPSRKCVTSVVPLAIEPNMMERWEMDLSPGIVTSP